MKTLTGLNGYIERAMSETEAELDRFVKKLNENPVNALEWSRDVFKAAARRYVAMSVYNMIERKSDAADDATRLNDIRETALDLALQGARYPQESTSIPSNLIHRDVVAAWAQLVEDLKW